MRRTTWLAFVAVIPLLSLAALAPARADDDDDDEHEEHEEHRERRERGEGAWGAAGSPARSASKPGVAPVSDPVVAKECGACHLAYPAGLLPARSWAAIASDLSDHYGEDASLPPEQRDAVLRYLLQQAADVQPGHRLSARVARATAGTTPTRITEVPFIRHEHAEIPRRLVQDNPQVRGFASCDTCHTRAREGSFAEREIRIPGVGRWED